MGFHSAVSTGLSRIVAIAGESVSHWPAGDSDNAYAVKVVAEFNGEQIELDRVDIESDRLAFIGLKTAFTTAPAEGDVISISRAGSAHLYELRPDGGRPAVETEDAHGLAWRLNGLLVEVV